MGYIDEEFWWDALGKPDWYMYLLDDFRRLEDLARAEQDYVVRKSIKRSAYQLVEKAYTTGHMPLANSGPNLDAERQTVDSIIIHHTSNPPGMSLSRLNAMHLLRIYGGYFVNPNHPSKEFTAGQPAWSGHFYKSKQVFWGYHWFVRANGKVEHILDDKYIGWQAGDWGVNTSSVAICIDDDLSVKSPDTRVIRAITGIIKKNYRHVQIDQILAHRDVNKKTNCPGDLYYSQWRALLLDDIF